MNTLPETTPPGTDRIYSVSGYCRSCNVIHGLPLGSAIDSCRQLIHHLTQKRTIDLRSPEDSDPLLSTEPLFGEARGKMFGILECRRPDGTPTQLRAFSGQFNGLWEVDGWAPPLFSVDAFHRVNSATERQIKRLTRQLQEATPQSVRWQDIRKRRRTMSRELMRSLHSLYEITNFTGTTSSLAGLFSGNTGIPTGTGDCCAPKLLNYAAQLGLEPVSLAEFYWGRANRSGTRRHYRFYPPCHSKCQPLLGFLLCGTGQENAAG